MKKHLLNYTTSIDSNKTISEIGSILSKNGARSIMTEYDDNGLPHSVTFTINWHDRLMNYRLPSSCDGVFRVISKQNIAKKYKTRDQAIRISWRILKVWVEAQMAIVETEQALITDIFLPYALTSSGKTLAQHFNEKGIKLLEQ